MSLAPLRSGEVRYEVVGDTGVDPATGKRTQSRKRYASLDEALAAHAELRTQVRAGTYVARSATTVEQACGNYLAGRHNLRPTTLACYADVLKPVRERYGGLALQALTKRHVDELVALLRAGGSAKKGGRERRPWSGRTVNLMLTTLGLVLDDAAKQGHVARNVARLVDRVPQPKAEFATLTAGEVRSLLASARGDRNRHAWHLALSGLRRGEVAGLRWQDVDLEARTLTVANNRVTANGRAYECEPKTERSRRTLPLTDELAAELRAARLRQRAERMACGPSYGEGAHVVADEAGRAYHPDTLSDLWGRVVAAAEGVRRIRLHDARHTCGTLMHLQGVPIAVISAWLGHVDRAFTMRTYTHSQDAELAAARDVLGSVVTSG